MELVQPISGQVTRWGGLAAVRTRVVTVPHFERRRFRPSPRQRGIVAVVMVVVVVKKHQFSHHLAVVGTSHVLVGVLGHGRRREAIRGWRRRGGRRWAPKAGHFRMGSVEVFVGHSADIQNGGLGPQSGLLGGHERTTYLPDVLSRHIKGLRALVLPYLPPVLVGLLNKHVALSLADGHHLVFGLVLIVELHLDVDLARGDGGPLSVGHGCRNAHLNSDLSDPGEGGST